MHVLSEDDPACCEFGHGNTEIPNGIDSLFSDRIAGNIEIEHLSILKGVELFGCLVEVKGVDFRTLKVEVDVLHTLGMGNLLEHRGEIVRLDFIETKVEIEVSKVD
jgi:hypothetical protein